MVLRKRFIAISSCIMGIVFGLWIPSLYIGFNANVQLLAQWKEIMLRHNISPVNGQDTIYSWLYRITGSSITEASQGIFVLSVLVFIALLVLILNIYNKRRETEISDTNGLEIKHSVFEYLVLIALIPNLTVTDSEHFLFSVPLIAWIINFLFIRKPGYLLTTICSNDPVSLWRQFARSNWHTCLKVDDHSRYSRTWQYFAYWNECLLDDKEFSQVRENKSYLK